MMERVLLRFKMLNLACKYMSMKMKLNLGKFMIIESNALMRTDNQSMRCWNKL